MGQEGRKGVTLELPEVIRALILWRGGPLFVCFLKSQALCARVSCGNWGNKYVYMNHVSLHSPPISTSKVSK